MVTPTMYSRNITESEGEMNQNIFCTKCHRIPSQCCCSSAEIQALHNLVKEQDKKILELAFDLEYARRTDEFVKESPQTDLIVLLREEVTLMQKYLQEQNLREHFVTWRNEE